MDGFTCLKKEGKEPSSGKKLPSGKFFAIVRKRKPDVIFAEITRTDMVLSYKWLMDYLPVPVEHEKLSKILNAIGLEVESYEAYEEVRGSLEGLLIGRVIDTSPHPNADKLTIASVDVGSGEPLQIVCGAPNVAPGQKVVVAPVGATIHPVEHPSMTMRVAKIRGVESHGMLCAEDEIGLGSSHAGILVLPEDVQTGIPAAEHFKPYTDHIISIGLTPNRSDASSHLGVARDICAWLNHHEKLEAAIRSPLGIALAPGDDGPPFSVTIENPSACMRYAGVSISGLRVEESPEWMKQRLKAIGQRPINNIVDITNYILHETGQPLHAFDADRITGKSVIVRNLPSGTPFMSLDSKERLLDAEDLMICDGDGRPMCIGGVFGGLLSGVTKDTTAIFLESACFAPTGIRKSSFRHGLRTDAATHFEKGVDISRTVDVLNRAADLICAIAKGRVASRVVDIYPQPAIPASIDFTFDYIRKLSGKAYSPQTVKAILQALGFTILEESSMGMSVSVPQHKTDITLPADIAEEIMRIDGFDNIAIPTRISFTPSAEVGHVAETLREKISGMLVGLGFQEMLNNSITYSGHYSEQELTGAVRMMNSLSAALDMLRPSMLETGLQTVAHNLNHRNLDLRLFEFGKTYARLDTGSYEEQDHLALFMTGMRQEASWKKDQSSTDLFHLKGIVNGIFHQLGLSEPVYAETPHERLDIHLNGIISEQLVAEIGRPGKKSLDRFDIRQEVWYADIRWSNCLRLTNDVRLAYHELPRFPTVSRDLAFVVHKTLNFAQVQQATASLKLVRLRGYRLFDVFESEKLGPEQKSMAMSFSFLDDEKTLTDEEVDGMMKRIILTFEKELGAQVRR